jgi:hypothetical protein
MQAEQQCRKEGAMRAMRAEGFDGYQDQKGQIDANRLVVHVAAGLGSADKIGATPSARG